MEVGQTFIVTGGRERETSKLEYDGYTSFKRYIDKWTPASTVTRYSLDGAVKFLPHLSVSRANHACATYINENGQNVS